MMARNALDIRMELPSDADMKRMFDAVPKFAKHDTLAEAVAGAAMVVRAEARRRAPRSRPEDRRKRSKSQRASANWEGVPLNATVDFAIRQYKNAAFGVVGPKHPHGNKAYFNQPRSRSRKHILWGRNVGRIYTATRNWIVEAFDTTKSQQLDKMKAVLKKKLDEMWLHG